MRRGCDMPKRRSAGPPTIGTLSAVEVDLLLTGDSKIDPFAIFDIQPDDRRLVDLWHTHRPALLAEHARRGLAGQPWGHRFDVGRRR